MLTRLEREVITDSILKIQSIEASFVRLTAPKLSIWKKSKAASTMPTKVSTPL